jgi:hypothetical protein
LRRILILIVSLSIQLTLTACTAAPASTLLPGLEQTLAVRTMVARQGAAFLATPTPPAAPLFAFSDNPSDPPQAFFTQPADSSPIPSLTPIGTGSSPLKNRPGCTNSAEFLGDVTFEDGSRVKPNQFFTKVWKVKNTGTCTWTTRYALVFVKGDRLSGITPKYLLEIVLPEQIIDLSIDLVAPSHSDTYQGNWMLQDENGVTFGSGAAQDEVFWVYVLVGNAGFIDIPSLDGSCTKPGG